MDRPTASAELSGTVADDDNSGDDAGDSQLFLSIPPLHDAATYFAQTASYLTQCFAGYSGDSEEGQELLELQSEEISNKPLSSSADNSQSTSGTNSDLLTHSTGETTFGGNTTSDLTELMQPARFFQNGSSLFQDLVDRARKTIRGSADDIGWLERERNMLPTEERTSRFLEILECIRRNEHKLPNSVVYLLVPGLFSNHGPLYFVKTKMYFSKMGLACHIAKIHSEASVETNAREIKNYIEEIYWGAQKKVLVLGHSKGGVDTAAALSLYWSDLRDKVAGLVLAQSPYGGSPVASDILREGQLGDYVRLRKIMEILICKVLKGDLQALEDLTYEKRKDFIRKHPLPREIPIVSFHTEAGITSNTLTTLSHVAHLELPAIAPALTDSQPTRLPVVMPLAAAMVACSQLLQTRYGEKSDGLVTRRDAEVPGSVVVRPDRKLDHAWMVYSSPKEEPSGEADTSQVCEALLTLLVEVGQKKQRQITRKDD
ncbi:hypothetical protein LUZ63_002746 [Rhynchospora breviuscula]|uniref:Alpha/beta-Hydrolases superfamily protein n=1 Tax=Rhynchospora breviuscula TaxID=2022672 RepID=A0A9Q0D0E3_9POAL|nr:hypothetical protein LUZ63_002746 [Rhynchospora breviuscula]